MQSPMDFESMSFGTRTLCRCAAEGTPASTRSCPTQPGPARPARPPVRPPRPIVDAKTDSHSPMLRILLLHQVAEADRRHQCGLFYFVAQNLSPVLIRRSQLPTPKKRNRAIRGSASYSRANSPRPIDDVKTALHNPKLAILLPRQLAETDRRLQCGIAQFDAQNCAPVLVRRDRSSTAMRDRASRCSNSYSRAHVPIPTVKVEAESHSPMLRILPPRPPAEADRRSQSGIAHSDARSPTAVLIRRSRSSKAKRHRAVRCSESYSCAHSPWPIVDDRTASHSPLRRITLPRQLAEADVDAKKRNCTARRSESYPSAHSPRPIVDANTESRNPTPRILPPLARFRARGKGGASQRCDVWLLGLVA